jgi:hypothetical protein
MDLGGRFNFWRVVILTRAITPPRAVGGLWPKAVCLQRHAWSVLLLLAVLVAGVVVRLSQRESSAIDLPPTSAPLGPAPSAQRW